MTVQHKKNPFINTNIKKEYMYLLIIVIDVFTRKNLNFTYSNLGKMEKSNLP